MLLDAGADANQADEDGMKPLHHPTCTCTSGLINDLYLEAASGCCSRRRGGAAVDAKAVDANGRHS